MTEHILLVEDTDSIVLAERMLHKLGYQVTTAGDLTSAIKSLNNQTFDLLFTDLNLPNEADGLALCRYAHEHHPALKILLTSGFCMLTDAELRAVGAVYLGKPYRRHELSKVLSDILQPSSLSTALAP